MTNRQLRFHIGRIKWNQFLATFLAVISAILISISVLLSNHCYDKWLYGEPEDTNVQIANIQRAIRWRPTDLAGYHKLLDIYLSDGILTEEENDSFREILEEQQARLNRVRDDAADLYRRLAFGYAQSYNYDPVTPNAEERLKKAYRYFELTQPYTNATDLEVTAINAYLALGNYFNEYIWISDTTRTPSTTEIETLMNQLTGMLDAYAEFGTNEEKLTFACALTPLIDAHGQLWSERLGADRVAALVQKMKDQLLPAVSFPVTIRLQTELMLWMSENYPWEVPVQ